MRPYKPELFTVEDVLNFYELQKGTCWRIYAGTNPRTEDFSRGEYTGNDKQQGSESLSENLMALRQNVDNTNCYTLHVFSQVKGKQMEKNAIIFQLNRPEKYQPYPAMIGAGPDPQLARILEKMMESQNLIVSKLSALDQMEEETEEVEEEKPGILGELMARPDVQNFLINGAMAFISGMAANKQAPPTNYGGGIAGTVDQESVTLLQSLFNKGVSNETLKALDQMSESKLKSLLMML